MLRTSENERPVKNSRRTSQARHGLVGISAYQLVVSEHRGRSVYLSSSVTSDIQGHVRDLNGTLESQPGRADDDERSTLAAPSYIVGNWSSDPTGDVIPLSDAEETDFRPRMGVSAVSEFAEGKFTYTYSGRELNQGPDEIAQMAPTSTPGPVFLRQEHGFRVEFQMEFSNEPVHYDIHDLLSSASIPSERDDPWDLYSVVEQPVARRWARPPDRVSTPPEWGTVSSRPSSFPDPFPVVADRLLEGIPRRSVSDLNVDPEVDLNLRSIWEDSGWSMAVATLSKGRVQHQLAKQFALGIDGETPTPSAVNMVERIARSVEAKTTDYVYSVDEDGAFSFDAWLACGLFIMCEVDLYGEINAGLYRSPTGPQESFLPRITEQELLDNF